MTFWTSEFGNTRAGFAIKTGAVMKRIHGVPAVRIEPLKAFAEGQCCGMPYVTEYISSNGASVHLWVGSSMDEACLQKAVRALIYWKDAMMLTWSPGEPLGYQTRYRLESLEDRQAAANEQAMGRASSF